MLLTKIAKFANFISDRQCDEFCRVFDEMGCKIGHPSPEAMIYHRSKDVWQDLYFALRSGQGPVKLIPLCEDDYGSLFGMGKAAEEW